MGDYISAVKRPFSEPVKLVVGALLSIIPIINFFSLGYVFEAARLSMVGNKSLPAWKNWKRLFVRGFFFTLISFIWILPFLIFVSLGISNIIIYSQIVSGQSPFVISPVLLSIGMIFGIIAWFLAPIALMEYIIKDRFLSAFNILFIARQAFTLKYFLNWLAAILIALVFIMIGNQIILFLSFIPVLNILLASVAYFAGTIVFYTIIAEAYSEII